MFTTDPNPNLPRRRNSGAALVLALSLLAIFAILGTAYLRYMNLSVIESDINLRDHRADELASAGVEVAAEALRQEVLHAERNTQKGEPTEFHFTSLAGINQDESGITTEQFGRPRLATATVTIYDESGRVNLNHAPAAVLERILNVDANTARKVASSVPSVPGGGGQWFVALDELVTRGLLTQDQFDAVDKSQITVFSAMGPGGNAGYFNVNVAAPAALAAVLGVTSEQATQIKSKGPFGSLAALGEAVSAVTGSAFSGIDGNAALGLTSRCFRVLSEGRYAKILDESAYDAAPAGEKSRYLQNRSSGRVEAVLKFKDDGTYEVLDWSSDSDVATEPA